MMVHLDEDAALQTTLISMQAVNCSSTNKDALATITYTFNLGGLRFVLLVPMPPFELAELSRSGTSYLLPIISLLYVIHLIMV